MKDKKVLKYLGSRALTFNEVVTSASSLKHFGLVPLQDVVGILEMTENEREDFLKEYLKLGYKFNEFKLDKKTPFKEKTLCFSFRLLSIWFFDKIQWRVIKFYRKNGFK